MTAFLRRFSLFLLVSGLALLFFAGTLSSSPSVSYAQEGCDNQRIQIRGKLFVNDTRISNPNLTGGNLATVTAFLAAPEGVVVLGDFSLGVRGPDDDYALDIDVDPFFRTEPFPIGSRFHLFAHRGPTNDLRYQIRTPELTTVVYNGTSITQDLHLTTYEPGAAYPLVFYSKQTSGYGKSVDLYQNEARVKSVTLTDGVASTLLGPTTPGGPYYRAEARSSHLRNGTWPFEGWNADSSIGSPFIPLDFSQPTSLLNKATNLLSLLTAKTKAQAPDCGITIKGKVTKLNNRLYDPSVEPSLIVERLTDSSGKELKLYLTSVKKADGPNGTYGTYEAKITNYNVGDTIKLQARIKNHGFSPIKPLVLENKNENVDFVVEPGETTVKVQAINEATGIRVAGLMVEVYDIKNGQPEQRFDSVTTQVEDTTPQDTSILDWSWGDVGLKAAKEFTHNGVAYELSDRSEERKFTVVGEDADEPTLVTFKVRKKSVQRLIAVEVRNQYREFVPDIEVKVSFENGATPITKATPLRGAVTLVNENESERYDGNHTVTLTLPPEGKYTIEPGSPTESTGSLPGVADYYFFVKEECYKPEPPPGPFYVVYCGEKSIERGKNSPPTTVLSLWNQEVTRIRSRVNPEHNGTKILCYFLITDKPLSTPLTGANYSPLSTMTLDECQEKNLLGGITVPLSQIEDVWEKNLDIAKEITIHELAHAFDNMRGYQRVGTRLSYVTLLVYRLFPDGDSSDDPTKASYQKALQKTTDLSIIDEINKVFGSAYYDLVPEGNNDYWRKDPPLESFAEYSVIYEYIIARGNNELQNRLQALPVDIRTYPQILRDRNQKIIDGVY